MTHKKCLSLGYLHITDEHRLAKEPRSLADSSIGINKTGNAGIRAAGDASARFDRAHNRNLLMLIGCRCPSEPGIVGDHHQKIGTALDELADQFREGRLVTNRYRKANPESALACAHESLVR